MKLQKVKYIIKELLEQVEDNTDQIATTTLTATYISQLEGIINSMEGNANEEYVNTLKGLVTRMKEEN